MAASSKSKKRRAVAEAAIGTVVGEEDDHLMDHATATDLAKVRKGRLVGSRVFQPFRALGFITNDVPFALQTRGGVYFVTTCTGNSFQIYECGKLGLLFVGPQTTKPISAMTVAGDLTFAACGHNILVFNRAKLQHTLLGHRATVLHVLHFGELLLSLDEENTLCTWRIKTSTLESSLEFGSRFQISALCHPDTYLNKILVATNSGNLQLWNINTNKLVYDFPGFGEAITYLASSPATDVVAVGLLTGAVILYNIRYAERVLTVQQEGPVTSIAFRTDERPVMATGNTTGDIALWDMEEQQLAHLMKGAHDSVVTSLSFFNGEPILLSASSDNSIKQWIFDAADGSGRLLRSRSGHSKPPTAIQFYGSKGHHLLSAGSDRALRDLSVIRDSQSVELSQGSLAKKAKVSGLKIEQLKLPIITDLAAAEIKEREWDNIATCHLQHPSVFTWRYQNKALGQHEIKSKDSTFPKSVCISSCGNFVIIGYASGRVDVYNIQSGLYRRTFSGHSKAVTGIAIDSLNRRLVTCSLDATVKIWDFHEPRVLFNHDIGSSVTMLTLLKESDLVAIASDDLAIRVIDIDTNKIVRVFRAHSNRITDMAFSPDARWLVSAGMDATVLVWDLPSAQLVDRFLLPAITTSLAFSPTADFIATTHVDHVGVYLWANRQQFSNVALTPLALDASSSSSLTLLELPTASGVDHDDDIDDSFFVQFPTTDSDSQREQNGIVDHQQQQLDSSLITLSSLPKARWQNLLNLDVIKARNKPIEPPKQPEKAPFFLPTLPGLKFSFAPLSQQGDQEKSHLLKDAMVQQTESHANALLRQCAQSHQNFELFLDYMLSLGPSATDVTIRSLQTPDSNQIYIRWFGEFLLEQLGTNRNFEILQSYLQVYLQVHSDMLTDQGQFADLLQRLKEAQSQGGKRLAEAFHHAVCLVDVVRNAPF